MREQKEMTQNELILEYLMKHGSITQAEAASRLGCFRLSARIYDLKQLGHRFTRINESGLNRFGTRETHARYFLSSRPV